MAAPGSTGKQTPGLGENPSWGQEPEQGLRDEKVLPGGQQGKMIPCPWGS